MGRLWHEKRVFYEGYCVLSEMISLHWIEKKFMAERVGFELTSERKFKNMQRTGCAF